MSIYSDVVAASDARLRVEGYEPLSNVPLRESILLSEIRELQHLLAFEMAQTRVAADEAMD